MTTIHLTDAQRDTFTACDLIVIDGEQWEYQDERNEWHRGALVAPESWRILTEPCGTCDGQGGWSTTEHECLGDDQWQAVQVDTDCPDCVGGRRVVALTATCSKCKGVGVSQAGAYACSAAGCLGSGVVTLGRFTIDLILAESAVGESLSLRFDTPPRPGQFIAKVEPVP